MNNSKYPIPNAMKSMWPHTYLKEQQQCVSLYNLDPDCFFL